jgi:hypothetical protein
VELIGDGVVVWTILSQSASLSVLMNPEYDASESLVQIDCIHSTLVAMAAMAAAKTTEMVHKQIRLPRLRLASPTC